MKATKVYIRKIYKFMIKSYGYQGWWPLLEAHGKSPTRTGAPGGYHPGDYSYPKNDEQRYEICVGALLTQNTAWVNAEQALMNLKEKNLLSPGKIQKISLTELAMCIKPSGYFNQKAKKIKEFNVFFKALRGSTPKRKDLLSVRGIGPETADSILLYAYGLTSFVVDTYTSRIFMHLGLIKENTSYDEIKALFEASLPRDYKIYQEYHALIVRHAKRHYSKKGKYETCPLAGIIKNNRKEGPLNSLRPEAKSPSHHSKAKSKAKSPRF